MKKCSIGGQGVFEGVMMRSAEKSALAVRKENGEIVTKEWANTVRKGGVLTWPIIRGCVSFVEMMIGGVKVISDSAKLYDEEAFEENPSKVETFIAKKTGKSTMDVAMVLAVVVALIIGVGLFFVLPTFLASLIQKYIESVLVMNLIEGGIRILIFLGYMLFCTSVKGVNRVFMYHGAEHKTIACYESDEELTPENAKTKIRLHPRCGTSYLLLVMIISILIYSCLGAFGWNNNLALRFLSRIILLPIIAGISYELLKLFAKSDNWFCRVIRFPGLQLQRLTTKEPDESMLEIAIVAFEMALGEKTPEETKQMIKAFDRSVAEPEEENECDNQEAKKDSEQLPEGELL